MISSNTDMICSNIYKIAYSNTEMICSNKIELIKNLFGLRVIDCITDNGLFWNNCLPLDIFKRLYVHKRMYINTKGLVPKVKYSNPPIKHPFRGRGGGHT